MLLNPAPTSHFHNADGARSGDRGRSGVLDLIRSWHPSPVVATLTVTATAVAYATTSIFVRHLTATGMSVIAVAFFRFALTAAVLVRFVNFAPHVRSATRWGLTSGAVMAVGWIVYVNTIASADVAIAGVVQMTYPLFAVVSGWLFFANRPGGRAVLAGIMIVAASALGLGVGSGGDGGFAFGPALLLLFVAPATFGFSVAVLTERLGPLDPFERSGSVTLGASVAMSPLLLTLTTEQVIPQTFGALGWVVAIGAISALIPMTVYSVAAPLIGTARTAAVGALELPTLFVIGAVVFGEAIQLRHVAAAGLIIAAIALSRTSRAPHVIADVIADGEGHTHPAPTAAVTSLMTACSHATPTPAPTPVPPCGIGSGGVGPGGATGSLGGRSRGRVQQ